MSAADIYQHWLDTTAPLMLAGDVDAIADMIVLPHRRKSPEAELLIETRADLIAGVRGFSDALRAYGVNHFISLVREAEFLSDTYIEGIHDVHILRNASPVIPAFQDRFVLKQAEQGWQLAELQTALRSPSWPSPMLVAGQPDAALDLFADDDARRSTADACAIYQGYLDQIAETVAQDNFYGYCDLQHFPYRTHGASLDQVIEGPEDLRPFYDVLRRCHSGEVGDRIERIATRAEFITGDRICGYHESTAYLGDKVTVPTVHSRMILRRTGTVWRLQSVTNSIDNTEYPFSMYEPGGTLRTELEVNKRTKTWPTSH